MWKIRQWITDNSSFIQTVAAVLQAIIAVLMSITLIEGYFALMQGRETLNLSNQTLSITKRQLESTIDPFIAPNMYSLATGGTKIRITNEGSVDVKNIYKEAMIAGWFDLQTHKITISQISRPTAPGWLLKDSLPQKDFFDIEIASHIIPTLHEIPISNNQPNYILNGLSVYGLVLSYQRVADMKPFVILLPILFV